MEVHQQAAFAPIYLRKREPPATRRWRSSAATPRAIGMKL